jgi:hypothetical protein
MGYETSRAYGGGPRWRPRPTQGCSASNEEEEEEEVEEVVVLYECDIWSFTVREEEFVSKQSAEENIWA